MNRRNLLKSIAAVPSVELLRAQQPATPPKPDAPAIDETPTLEAGLADSAALPLPSHFSPDQYSALDRLSELIAPAGSSGVPGAKDAGAAAFLDFLIGESPAPRQDLYKKGLDELNHQSKAKFDVLFAKSSAAQADQLLAPLREPWAHDANEFTAFLRSAKSDILQATQGSYVWSRAMSKRSRSATGLAMYWFPIG